MGEPQSTTIQVSTDIWAALDRRKQSNETFDDVIRRLIEATGIGVGELAGPHPDIHAGPPEPFDGEAEKGCAHYDTITGEECGGEVAYRQAYRFEEDGDERYFYYCEGHVPDDPRMATTDEA